MQHQGQKQGDLHGSLYPLPVCDINYT